MTADLAIIIVNYRTLRLTVDCLASLEGEIQPGVRVVIVDNASGDGSPELLESAVVERGWSSWASVLRSPVNGGFAAGNNLGIRSIDAAAYVLLNSDTLVRPGALRSLREAMLLHPDAGIIGAGCLDVHGNLAHSAFRFHSPLSELLRAASTGPVTRLLRQFDPVLPLTDKPVEPEWVGFPCVLIRREVFETAGFLDDGYFMYFEDVDYCRRAALAGWKILYWPLATVVHLGGGSSQEMADEGSRRRAPRYYYESRARYFAKYYRPRGLWLANGLWYAGRLVSLSRELLGRPASHREHEALDIWIGASDRRRSRRGPKSTMVRTLKRDSEQSQAEIPEHPTPSHSAPRPLGDRNMNPRDIGLLGLIAEDYRTHDHNLLVPGFLAIAVHRFGNARLDVKPKLLRAPLSLAYSMLYTAVNWTWGIDLPYVVRLGRRVRIWHHGGMVLGARSIGDDVHIRQNTTFGVRNRQNLDSIPIIGNRVDIGAGACVVGAITVGDDCVIGPNSVVLRHVPAGSVVMGVPARQANLGVSEAPAPSNRVQGV